MAYQDNLQRYFGELARYGEPALTAGSSAIAEPISGLIGLGYTLAGQGNNAAVNAINKTQQAMTYQPRTAEGLQGLQGLQDFLQPVGDIVQGASQKLGDKAYSATGSPSLAAAAYSAPTALLEGLGLKGFNIARNPVSGSDLHSPKMNAVKVEMLDEVADVGSFIDFYKSYENKIPDKLLHGTSGTHKELSTSYAGDVSSGAGEGLWLTDSRKYAWEYAQNAASKRGSTPKIMSFLTSEIKNPLVVEFTNNGTAMLNGVEMPDIYDNNGVISIAKKIGADSVWFPEGSFTDEPSLVVFDSNKIKFSDEEVFK